MIKDHYKIGFTTDIDERKKAYVTAYPVACNWDYISDKISNIKTRERLIFQRLKEYRFNDSREFFICPLHKIKSTIEEVFKMTLKEMNLELNIKEWKLEVPIFLKKTTIKKKDKSNYNKVLLEDLYRCFSIWCMAKNIKKKCKLEEFQVYLEDKKYKLKSTKNFPNLYLEKVEYKI